MLKIEYIWRDLLTQAIEEKKNEFTLTDLSLKFKLSTSVVSHALFPLREMGMVKVGKNKSHVIDTERLLMYWATRRNLKKEIIYQTYSSLPVLAREASMPHGVLPTAYSGYACYKKDPPADYEHIYYYAERLDTIIKRFPQIKKKPNIFILAMDPYLKIYLHTPLAQIYVDLWNLHEWYAKEFSQEVFEIINERIGL